MSGIVIPDSIEPRVGWKALAIDSTGQLCSPQQKTVWPVRKRLEASCSYKPRAEYHWVAVPEDKAEGQIVLGGMLVIQGPLTTKLPPKTLPPPGHVWAWVEKPHQVVSPNCRCGIYVVDDIKQAATYLGMAGVLVKVALWGRVVPGTQGARGQYAYPLEMFAPDTLTDVAQMVADLYGIPVGFRDHKTGRTLRYEQAMVNLEQLKRKHEEAESFPPVTGSVKPVMVTTTTSNKTPGIVIAPPVYTNDVEFRQGAQIFAFVCMAAILTVMLAAIVVSPFIVPFALPFILGFARAFRDGWA